MLAYGHLLPGTVAYQTECIVCRRAALPGHEQRAVVFLQPISLPPYHAKFVHQTLPPCPMDQPCTRGALRKVVYTVVWMGVKAGRLLHKE